MTDEIKTTAEIMNTEISWNDDADDGREGFEALVDMAVTVARGEDRRTGYPRFLLPLGALGGRTTPFDQVELSALQSLPTVLRDAADQVERQIEEAAQRQGEARDEPQT